LWRRDALDAARPVRVFFFPSDLFSTVEFRAAEPGASIFADRLLDPNQIEVSRGTAFFTFAAVRELL
jgi:hypothetical protein